MVRCSLEGGGAIFAACAEPNMSTVNAEPSNKRLENRPIQTPGETPVAILMMRFKPARLRVQTREGRTVGSGSAK